MFPKTTALNTNIEHKHKAHTRAIEATKITIKNHLVAKITKLRRESEGKCGLKSDRESVPSISLFLFSLYCIHGMLRAGIHVHKSCGETHMQPS